ncbi:IS1634 family transposase, partial [Streptomyces mirabilis]|uniref:IS1634 family transposase n=1 Tax=Streptomyces mirabilis TaxID=68239 RepID=UPI003498BCDB
MYLRTVTRKNKNGSSVSYLQLAHNEWDAAAQVSRRTVLYNFGRTDQVDRDAIARLIASLSQVLAPGQAMAATAPPELAFTESRPLGGTHALDGLWRRLGIDAMIRALVKDPRARERTERTLFALVANRALKPSSKLAASHWVSDDVAIDGLPAVDDDACYRAMDRLLTMESELAEQVYWSVADLLNLEVDLLFFDTTSTYFETGQADEPLARNEYGQRLDEPAPKDAGTPADSEDPAQERGFRAFGKSKDHRDDLPQVIIGMAVTRTGIPIRVWSWP